MRRRLPADQNDWQTIGRRAPTTRCFLRMTYDHAEKAPEGEVSIQWTEFVMDCFCTDASALVRFGRHLEHLAS